MVIFLEVTVLVAALSAAASFSFRSFFFWRRCSLCSLSEVHVGHFVVFFGLDSSPLETAFERFDFLLVFSASDSGEVVVELFPSSFCMRTFLANGLTVTVTLTVFVGVLSRLFILDEEVVNVVVRSSAASLMSVGDARSVTDRSTLRLDPLLRGFEGLSFPLALGNFGDGDADFPMASMILNLDSETALRSLRKTASSPSFNFCRSDFLFESPPPPPIFEGSVYLIILDQRFSLCWLLLLALLGGGEGGADAFSSALSCSGAFALILAPISTVISSPLSLSV